MKNGNLIVYGRQYKTKIFDSLNAANSFLSTHSEYGVIGVETLGGKEFVHVALNRNKGRSISRKTKHNTTPLKWYLGLTKDFRDWKILATTGNPDYSFANKYIWFYGPFKTKTEAEQFKKTEGLKNPRQKRRR